MVGDFKKNEILESLKWLFILFCKVRESWCGIRIL